MGKTTEKLRSAVWAERTASSIRNRQADRAAAEGGLAELEGALGDPNYYGDFDFDERTLPYTARYELDSGLMNANLAGAGRNAGKYGYDAKWSSASGYQSHLNQMNSLMDQAEAAARAGDYDKAEKFRTEAETLLSQVPGGVGLGSSGRDAFNLRRDFVSQAQSTATSPMGRLVTETLQRARAYLDPDSEEYNRLYDALTEGALAETEAGRLAAERGIIAERRMGDREVRRLGATRGAARSPGLNRALTQRQGERAATQRANVELEAGAARATILSEGTRYIEDMARTYAPNAVGFARAFAQGSPGIREQHQGALDALGLASAQISADFSKMHFAEYRAAAAREDANKNSLRDDILTGVGMIAAVVGAFFTGGATLAAIPALAANAASGTTGDGIGGTSPSATPTLSGYNPNTSFSQGVTKELSIGAESNW